ncbi:MAG: ribosome biogenesis GTP-binding protein YihA/YsxC [Saprospiraceae bacterium]
MKINTADYTGSYPNVRTCPKSFVPEYAFIGRSNVGKSSLINMLTGRNGLARISKKPGKTQHLNYYIINKSWNIVDLPGYGYAVISKTKRKEWEKMIEGYLLHRENLMCAVVLIDINIPPQKIDIEFINWMGQMQIPYVIAFTKADRLKPNKLESSIEFFKEELLKYWNDLPQFFITSSNKKTGQEELLDFFEKINAQYVAPNE